MRGTSPREPLLVLAVADRWFALSVHHVVEVALMVEITPLPDADSGVLGVVDVRGRTVPVVDLRTRLGLGSVDIHPDMRIVFVESTAGVTGLVVDDTLEIAAPEVVEPPPAAAHGTAVRALVRLGERLVSLLEPERVCVAERWTPS